MDVLISWSGRQSRSVAEALYEWLPKVIPSLRPWMSTQDIDKGTRWSNELQKYLGTAKTCIVCLTPENITSPWVYWETGAIALTQENPICPLLINIVPEDIKNNPLAQFQCTFNRKDEVLHLVRSLNQRLENPEDELRLRGLFESNWEELRKAFTTVAQVGIPSNVLTLIKGIEEAKEKFRRRWESDKKAESWDPIKHLTAETANSVEQLVAETGVEKRIQLHCHELKSKIAGIISPSSRDAAHERGDKIFAQFDKAIGAIRADYENANIN